MLLQNWDVLAVGEPLVLAERAIEVLDDVVVVEVAGCGVCQSDLDLVVTGSQKPRHHLPLGHEVSGTVVDAGPNARDWLGRSVVIPAVPPTNSDHSCYRCDDASQGPIANSHFRSGLASHVTARTHGLCVVDPVELENSHLELADLAILAEAIGTPYQAIVRSKLRENDVCIFVGATGLAAFGIQIASALGAYVIALDVEDDNLEQATKLGASFALNVERYPPKVISQQITEHAKSVGLCSCGWKVFETSGTLNGQELACALLSIGGVLSVIGPPLNKGVLRLDDLVSKVATAQGTCCCSAELLPGALDLILAGDIKIDSLIERRPMSTVNETLMEMRHERAIQRRILIPDFA